MVARTSAAPPTPWSESLAEPQIHETAYLHSFSEVIGDVRIGANVLVAPGTSIRADEGGPFFIGDSCNIQDGVVIHGLEEGRVLGDDQQPYSVWIGAKSSITHKALIHGPAYVGEGCFIGFRSTVFNARLGKGCVVMMHALIQDVEVPPGSYIPSGAVITTQQQADQLPKVQTADRHFAKEVLGVNEALRLGYICAEDSACIMPIRAHLKPTHKPTQSVGMDTMQSQRLTPEVIQQVRQLLSQGYKIGAEHADRRRYRSGVWQTCTPIQSTRESEVLSALDACVAEHAGEYVRMFGIDSKVKQRVATTTIQRGDGKAVAVSPMAVATAGGGYSSARSATAPIGYAGQAGLNPDLVQQVRNLLNQGYKIGTEHADSRRYRSGVWQTCAPIGSSREPDVLSALEACLSEHAGEYVRMFGIDTRVKQRVSTTTIQRGDGKPVAVNGSAPEVTRSNGGYAAAAPAPAGQSEGVAQQVRSILAQGNKVGIEYADRRRYRSGIWQTAPAIRATSESAALNELSQFLAQNADAYVRIFGINPAAKQRTSAVTIQKPGQGPIVANPPVYNAYPDRVVDSRTANHANGNGAHLASDVAQQITQLINQGYRISTEYADQRRYRSGAWQTGNPIQATRPSDAIAALESQLAEHQGHYVRLVGIDPRAKRRVLETTIQRP